MILIDKVADVREIGGKAHTLFSLNVPNTPTLLVVPASYFSHYMEDSSLAEKLQEELNSKLDSRKLYAVRSSAVDEDSAAASFAGIHSSFLNVKKEDVLEHIFKVYRSAFSERAIEYRKINEMDTKNIGIAVIVQEMVAAELSGVAFTINPVTNNPDEIIISVTKGLGEGIVDGSVSGSTYTLSGKDVKLRGEDILTKKQLKAILEMIKTVSQKTECFLDIEFSVVNNTVYFLQARPVVAYKDINPKNRSLFIDNSNIIESYFGVTSPLTYTFAKDVYRDVYTATLKCGKVRKKILDELKPSLAQMLYMYEGKIYYNMNSWYHVNSIFPAKKTASHMEGMMGVKSSTDSFKKLRLNLIDMIKIVVALAGKLIKIDAISDRFEKRFDQIVLPYYGRTISGSNEELYELFCTIESKVVKEFVVPIINDCAVMIYFGMLREKAKKLNISKETLNKYISNHGNVKSVGSATQLINIVETIRSDKELLWDFENLTEDRLAVKYKNDSKISEALNRYRLEFGARVGDELKLETITMIEDETLLYRAIKQTLGFTLDQPVCDNTDIPKKLRRLGEKTKKFIKNRERLRLKRTYIYSVVRNIFLAYGRNYYNDGRIDDPRDIFYLTKQEVFSGNGDFKSLIKMRKLEQEQNRQKPTYDRIVFYGDKVLPVRQTAEGGGLCGIPTGAGVVTARVRLMNSPNDILLPGELILTKRTDPGWIGLFPRAAGLIVEHGSMLSHSFVVAREMNLPAVVGIENVTERISDGALVTLDGVKGIVTVEEDKKEYASVL
ncbi:MAG: hypothetical protein IJF58_05005 [Clostridia bacterium]|nr:hypothetical protein [Clostridia bacterium]